MARKHRGREPAKTNALRALDRAGVSYEVHAFPVGEGHLTADEVADLVGLPRGQVFKTLVARGDATGPVFAVVPGSGELDLKALARASDNRRVALVPLAEVTALTGYVRGGTTVLAAKRAFPAYLDVAAEALSRLTVSAGQRGLQVSLAPRDYLAVSGAKLAPIAAR